MKALLLSPGVLFSVLYLAIWLSTNLYLDHGFRNELIRFFQSASGSRYRLSIGKLSTGPELGHLTLRQLELSPVAAATTDAGRNIRIDKLDISCPDIGFLLVRPSKSSAILRTIVTQLLSRYVDKPLSMNKETGPGRADRGDFSDRIEEQ